MDGQDMEGRKPGKKQMVKDKLGGSGVEGEGWIYYDNKVIRVPSYLDLVRRSWLTCVIVEPWHSGGGRQLGKVY